MAVVYAARDLRHDRKVAIKVLASDLAASLAAERFLREIGIAAKLNHPHILPVFDSGEANGVLYYVMPFVEGESLRDRLRRERQLPLEDALAITREVAGALAYAHRHAVIHRDIKPENILLSEGHALVADFGIARAVSAAGTETLTGTGMSIGTPHYMSPEQAMGDQTVDARSDQYSLACTLYEMLAGEPPFTGPTPQAVVAKQLAERPPSLTVVRQGAPPAVVAAIERALAKVPADRFAGAPEFAAALEQAEVRGARTKDRSLVNRGWRLAPALALVAVAAVAAWLTLRTHGPRAVGFVPDLVQLTTDGNARAPSLSPDGTRLAYIARDCDEQQRCVNRLVVQDTGGAGSTTMLASPSIESGRWATGGRYLLVFLHGGTFRQGTYAVPALGGAPRFLSAGTAGIVGTSDTVLVSPGGLLQDTVARFQFMTVSDGIVRDSFALHGPVDFMSGIPAPQGGNVAVLSASFAKALITLLIVNRLGRVLDSMLLSQPRSGYSVDGPVWSPQGDAVLWEVRPGSDVDRPVVLRRRVAGSGRFSGTTDTLLQLDPGTDLEGVTTNGAALIQKGPTERVAYALRRSTQGRLDFQVRRLVTATTDLLASPSADGKWVLLIRGSPEPQAEGRRYSLIPFDGGEERPFNVPTGGLVGLSLTRPVPSGLLALSRDASNRLRLHQIVLASGEARDLGPVPDSTDEVRSIPGGGWYELRSQTRSVRTHARPGRADTTWTFPPEPGRTLAMVTLSADARTLWTAWTNATSDTAWLGRVPLDGRPAPPPVKLRYTGFFSFLLYDDGSFEYPMSESETTSGWYRVPAGGTKAVRLGDAPLQGDAEWHFAPSIERCVAVKSVDKPDVYLIRNFTRLLR